ncbi:chlorophyllase [Glaciihabitans sp. dw_435]|uniref:alpha/beta hydrolase family protein n=1 Tax=Glaciihabitans sp. dw_435 TaxID=2720081 RepID=UPI001BD5273B|nr:chlorophyllase [Glaciihabitans sp. dw_435]
MSISNPLSTVQTVSVKPVILPAPNRGDDLQVRVTAPVSGTDLPVILFAHGFGGSMSSEDPLVDEWTANGFVVVQPTFLDSRLVALPPTDARFPDIWKIRIDDLERIINDLDAVLASVPGLAERVDLGRLAVAGHSWGGQSVGMLVGARVIGADGQPGESRKDPRVKAAVLLATTGIGGDDLVPFAQENFSFMSPDFAQLDTPSLVVAGDHDQSQLSTRGPDWFTDVYFQSPGAQSLVTLFGAEHSLGGITGYNSTETTDENPAAVALTAAASVAFLKTILGIDAGAWGTLVATTAQDPAAAGRIDSK